MGVAIGHRCMSLFLSCNTTKLKQNIKKLHKFVKKGTSLKLFTKNVSSIVAMSSYFLWNCRNNKEWTSPRYIEAPFKQ